jgi:hypothetical protein
MTIFRRKYDNIARGMELFENIANLELSIE